MPILKAPETPTHELPGIRITALASPSRGALDTAIWRLEIAPGTPPAPHQLTAEELFLVLEGRARVRLGGVDLEAAAGDLISVPPHVDFEITAGGAETMVALCCFPTHGRACVAGVGEFTPPWAA
jgi:quercetin dioxygenase-like cupin family protein